MVAVRTNAGAIVTHTYDDIKLMVSSDENGNFLKLFLYRL
jgi:hypothetical protein